jgi:hypothetical protein
MRRTTMEGLDLLQAVQFVTKNRKRFAVLANEDWEALIEWLETLEDSHIVKQALADLKAAKSNRRRAGWRKWEVVEDELT